MTRNAATISTRLFTLAASALSAQAPPRPRPPETYPMFLQAQYAGLKRNIIGSAEKMPAEHFSFKPSPDVRTYAQLAALNGTRGLTILNWSSETVASTGIGAPLLADGSVVQFTGTPEVYQFSAGALHHVTTYAALAALGGGSIPRIEQLPASYLAAYAVGAPIE